jgi:hypothetical protein
MVPALGLAFVPLVQIAGETRLDDLTYLLLVFDADNVLEE